MRVLLPLLPLVLLGVSTPAGCEVEPVLSADPVRIYGECPEDVIDIPIGWTVTQVTIYGTEALAAGGYEAVEMEIDTWEQDRFSVAVACPPSGSQRWEWRSINVWVEAPEEEGDTASEEAV